MKQLTFFLALAMISTHLSAQLPLGIEGNWVLQDALSDEFDGKEVDQSRWDNNVGDWGPWSWEPEHAYQDSGNLRIRMVYEPHRRSGMDLFYKSGIIRSRTTAVYGYFEARVRGCELFPGACPAFWMKGNVGREYAEIDFIEIEQSPDNIREIDLNLHARIINSEGQEQEFRPGSAPDLCKHYWIAPWDPRDDFHVYACENRPDSIFWIINGQVVASEENRYWHLPMYVMLSMGLRPPHVKWVDGDRFPVPEAATRVGFPTEMQVDYIRIWMRDELSFHERDAILTSGSLFPVILDYSAPTARDILLRMESMEGKVLAEAFQTVSKGMGSVELTMETESALQPGLEVRMVAELRTGGGGPGDTIMTSTLSKTISEGARITFHVKDHASGEPIPGAMVIFNGEEQKTNLDGEASFQQIRGGDYLYSIGASHFGAIQDRALRVSHDETIEISLQPNTYLVEFRVTESRSGDPVSQAEIDAGEVSLITGVSGDADLEVHHQVLTHTVSKKNFLSWAGSTEVISDTVVQITLKRSAADLSFRVYHLLEVVEDARISVNKREQQTDSRGSTLFEGIPVDTTLDYQVSAEGFSSVSEEFRLTADTAVIVRLFPVGIPDSGGDGKLFLYPNPAHGRVTIQGISVTAEVQVYDITGLPCEAITIPGDPYSLDVSSLKPGIYIIHMGEGRIRKLLKADW